MASQTLVPDTLGDNDADNSIPSSLEENVIPSVEELYIESQSEQLTQLTQNELTQLCDFEEGYSNSMSPTPPPLTPINPRSIPWGRLIPCSRHANEGGRIDLFPRDPKRGSSSGGEYSFMGLVGIEPSDTFNEYTMGRSQKCNVVTTRPPPGENESLEEKALQEWAHALISNRHVKLYCMLKTNNMEMEVYAEDSSANGTLVNGTTLLRRGEKRILHTGDEICLVNPNLLKRKMRSTQAQTDLLRHHSFIFVNVHQQQGRHNNNNVVVPRLMPSPALAAIGSASVKKNKRKGLVDVRATKNHSITSQQPSLPTRPPNRRISPRRQPPRRIEEHYDIRDLLGSGTCGQVRRAIHRKTGKEFAVKIIATTKRTSSLLGSSSFEAEAAMLQELDHPHVVKLWDVFYNPDKAIYMVMELLHGGDLFDRIIQKTKYTEVDSRRVMRRLLNAIYYLHEDVNVVHRDLKPENILCVNRDSDVLVKLTDFGLAKSVTDEGLKTFCGTPQYFAPEVLRRRHTIAGRGRYGKQADLWSLGVILYILLSGMPPFDLEQGMDAVEEARVQFPLEAFGGVSEAAKNLVKKLLRTDPNKRLSVKEACEHEWILMQDGDTHTHPLDDPATASLYGKKRAEEKEKQSASNGTNVAKETNEVVGGKVTPGDADKTVANEKEESPSAGTEHGKGALSPRDLNQQLENFRQALAKSDGEKEVSASGKNGRKKGKARVMPSPLNIVVAPTSRGTVATHQPANVDADCKGGENDTDEPPLELADDEICSRFSDEEVETVSSFGSSTNMSDKIKVERIPSTSSSSLSEKDVPVKPPTKKRRNATKRPTPKSKKRRKSQAACYSPGAAADEGNLWKHVSSDEQSRQLKTAPTIRGSNKSQKAGNKGSKVVSKKNKNTQTTLASFFKKK